MSDSIYHSRRARRKGDRRRGFSLVEVLVAVTILALGLAGLFNLLDQCVKAQQRMSQRSGGYAAANELALERAGKGYDTLASLLTDSGKGPGVWLEIESGTTKPGTLSARYAYQLRLLWVGDEAGSTEGAESSKRPTGIRVSCLAWPAGGDGDAEAADDDAASKAGLTRQPLRQEYFVDLYPDSQISAPEVGAPSNGGAK